MGALSTTKMQGARGRGKQRQVGRMKMKQLVGRIMKMKQLVGRIKMGRANFFVLGFF
jgi:hypothetical protein